MSGDGDRASPDQSVQVWSEWCGLEEFVTAEGPWLTSQLFPGASIRKIGLFEEYLEHLCYPRKYFLRDFLSLSSTTEVAKMIRRLDKQTW